MDAVEFVRKWGDSALRERQASQSHFIDLCALLGVPSPTDDDPSGDRYCFERGVEKVGGGDGWADVWRRSCFGWEYKGRHGNLAAALRQLQAYALNLENPPFLVVSDMERIEVHTNWTNTVSRTYTFSLEDLYNPERRADLKSVLEGSDRLKPGIDRHELTAKAAAAFGELSRRLQDRGHPPRSVAHFLNRLVFCMFAEDAALLPPTLFTRTVRATTGFPDAAQAQLRALFETMRTGGFFGPDVIRWFNGGLFDDAETIRLEFGDLELLAETAAEHDWSEIDPAIFGTLFEQALKATRERPALGAHYTDREKILKIVEPTVVRPLGAEWDAVRGEIGALMAQARSVEAEASGVAAQARGLVEAAGRGARGVTEVLQGGSVDQKQLTRLRADQRKLELAASETRTKARGLLEAFQNRLSRFRVLDPACGSGNFLYVALHALRDLELKAVLDAQLLGLPAPPLKVGVEAVAGIEIEPYAAELARVTLWIGNLQWLIRRGYRDSLAEPLLSSLEQIDCRDALLNPDGTEAEWPAVDVIIGNPPFAGDKKQRELLDPTYLKTLRQVFREHVDPSANLVAYWFYKAARSVDSEQTASVGLVATQAIRRGSSARVLRAAMASAQIFEAWSNEPWALLGAAVRVSVVCWAKAAKGPARLNGEIVDHINPDLTADTAITLPPSLRENKGAAFQGTISGGPFEVSGEVARRFLLAPLNPNGRPDSDVLRPWRNGDDLTDRVSDFWIIDFGDKIGEADAALYERPFRHLTDAWTESDRQRIALGKRVLREGEPKTRAALWSLQRRRSKLLRSLNRLDRFIATPRVSKFRLFVWLAAIVPDTRLVVLPRADDLMFGVLQSKHHEVWSIRFGARHGVGNDPEYEHTRTFETFPFPEGLTPNIPAADYAGDPRAVAIAAAARRLNELREAWLNPADLVVRTPEVVPGYPDRLLPKDEDAAKELKQRTLTRLYNDRPAWLDMAHQRLDAAVAAAYGWPADLTDEEVLERLFALNQQRAAAGR